VAKGGHIGSMPIRCTCRGTCPCFAPPAEFFKLNGTSGS
jgi:hypothetical protein